MPVNLDKPHQWKSDIRLSVDLYNAWFLRSAPQSFRDARARATTEVESAIALTMHLTDISPAVLSAHPEILFALRMSTAPPIARDRLIGLANVSKSLVSNMEMKMRIPPRMPKPMLDSELKRVEKTITNLLDVDIFPWIVSGLIPAQSEIYRAATIVADRLCGALSNPIIRNAQERRQLALISGWLDARGYQVNPIGTGLKINTIQPGTYSLRLNVPGTQQGRA